MDTSTLLVVFLLVTAATVASYALSHWSSIRGALGFGWAATSIGTTMLLTAAAIVVLTFVFRGPLWRPHLGNEQQLREAAAAQETLRRRIATSPFAATGTGSTSGATADPTATVAAKLRTADDSPAGIDNKQQAQKTASSALPSGRSSQAVSAFSEADPWAATRCVYIATIGASAPFRSRIDNGCDAPVGVVVNGSAALILPAPAQRPVSLAEQSVDGAGAHYLACFIATAKAIELISAPLEERSTPAWREQFEAARANDACLLRLPSTHAR